MNLTSFVFLQSSNLRRLFLLCAFAVFSILALASNTIAADPGKGSLTFAVMGDTGTGDEAQMAVAAQMVKQHAKTPFDTVIMLGDNIYEKGEEKYIGSHFETPYKDLLAAGVKFYAALGNHDIVKGLEFQTNYKNFNMGGRRYYRFTQAGMENLIEFFCLDSNLVDAAQLTWLENQLKASTAQWKVVYCHHSIYSSARMHRPYVKLREMLEPLYTKYGVTAVFAGHSHCYERVKPQKGVNYFTAGSGGEIKRGTLDRKSPLTAYGNDQVNIFLIVTADDKEMKVSAIAADGTTVDSHTIRK